MQLLNCVLMSLLLMVADERVLVSGSDESISASVGEDVTLNCSVDSHITPEHIEEVSWKKTDEDGDILVLLFQNNETLSDSSDERYRDRVEFFTAEIPKGNFSLRLKRVRTEDKGVYMCLVFADGASVNATVELKSLGFSALHIMVLMLCITACGSALLLCCLIYCRCWDFSKAQCQVVQRNCGFSVEGPSGPLISLGSSVILPCHVHKSFLKKSLKVEWRRTDSGTLVHLYQSGESQKEVQQQDYHGRAHFFTEEIQDGNFSLQLDNLRAEDGGKYTCKVYSGQDCVHSAETDLILSFEMETPSGYHSVPLGSSMVLPCKIKKRLLKKSLKVEWRRTDSETLVHLYEDGESRAEKQHKDYHRRAHFITKEIQHGNFSLRLDDLRAEDGGKYTCTVYSHKENQPVYSTSLEITLRFDVKLSHQTLALLGSSVVLPVYTGKPLPVKDLKVEWRRNAERDLDSETKTETDSDSDSDSDSETLVHLYEDGESRAEKQHRDYHDRAHFFSEEIQHGNFSLHLDDLRAEDEGRYTCRVYRNEREVLSINQNLELRLLDPVFHLQLFLVFCPNILMSLAFVLWGCSEGFLNESVSCCALYFLRPLMLLWVAPFLNNFTGNIKEFIKSYSYETEYIVFSAVFYSVLFKSVWNKSLNYAGFEGVMIIVLFVIVLLFNLIYIVFLLDKVFGKLSERIETLFRVLASMSFDVLPSLQFLLLFYAFGSARAGFFIIAVLPVFLTVTNYDWESVCGQQIGCSPSVRRSVWLILMLLINGIMVYFYILALENEKDRIGWACVIVFLQGLWAMTDFIDSFKCDIDRVVPVYVFGSVGVVLLNSVTLMTELILKTVNGQRSVGDMRVVVFSSEFFFTLFLMVLLVSEPWIKSCLQSNQSSARSDETPADESNQNKNKAESHEMNPLLNQLGSVVSQS